MARLPFVDNPDPNIVLRGGPFDGGRMRVDGTEPVVTIRDGDLTCVYEATGEADQENPELAVYAHQPATPTTAV